MPTPRSIAVIRTDRIGDMVLTLPMFAVLRRRFPDATLVLCARRYVQPLVEHLDVIDHVVYVDDAPAALREGLRTHHVDTAFFPRPRFGEVMDAWRAGVQRRIGSAFRWYAPLFTHRVRDHRSDAAYHEAEYNVRMIVSAFGGPMPAFDLVHLRPSGTHRSVPPLVIIHPGSGGSARDWPAERFGELARRLHAHGATIIVTGIASERERCDAVLAACPDAMDRCGHLDLRAMIDLCAEASLVCANSTGVLHVAAACGTPVLGFYPRTPAMSRHRWGPYTSRAIVLESDEHDVMTTITVDAAVDAAMRSLQGMPASDR
jgi:heptosyltransferase III